MINFTKMKSRFLIIGLLLMTMTGIVEARSGHHSNNKHYKYDRGHHGSYRHYYPVGHRISLLPAGYLTLSLAGLNYYYHSGAYYQRLGHEYALVRPPLGVGISILPAGYRTHYRGRHQYYTANGVFYGWNERRRSYVVVDDPYASTYTGMARANVAEQFVYPRQGQSTTQTSRDRYECYLWAVNQTGVEPAQVNNADTATGLENYQRANGACLEARGYSVK